MTPARIAELRALCAVTLWNHERLEQMGHALPEALDEIERLREVIERHLDSQEQCPGGDLIAALEGH